MGNTSSSQKNPSTSSLAPVLATLALLKARPDVFFTTYGVVVRPTSRVGGKCTLRLKETLKPNVFAIEVTEEAGSDWYLPYQDKQAVFIDVPKGQPEGTLVVTHPMNGCALSVHETTTGLLRFFHDSDGKCMDKSPHPETGAEKFRVIASEYRGGQTLDIETEKMMKQGPLQNAENAVISIKRGTGWEVYNSAIISAFDFELRAIPIWINKGIPPRLGAFTE
ncbi:hypothetical protein [Metapseudomonas otitidis]|uniref:hypothetical protein n=1 Tax=Metapseudomonas otitidis TaxID=319939 RepID=UPI00244BD742|nr:hypothetical protein [Pseudomonas otitidis]MDG9780481.1 hypothetical protein [Pseudomonas otitidis]